MRLAGSGAGKKLEAIRIVDGGEWSGKATRHGGRRGSSSSWRTPVWRVIMIRACGVTSKFLG